MSQFAEDFWPEDMFHQEVQKIYNVECMGTILAIVWSKSPTLRGMVISETVNEMQSRRFTVELIPEGYRLKFMGSTVDVKSDYFGE